MYSPNGRGEDEQDGANLPKQQSHFSAWQKGVCPQCKDPQRYYVNRLDETPPVLSANSRKPRSEFSSTRCFAFSIVIRCFSGSLQDSSVRMCRVFQRRSDEDMRVESVWMPGQSARRK